MIQLIPAQQAGKHGRRLATQTPGFALCSPCGAEYSGRIPSALVPPAQVALPGVAAVAALSVSEAPGWLPPAASPEAVAVSEVRPQKMYGGKLPLPAALDSGLAAAAAAAMRRRHSAAPCARACSQAAASGSSSPKSYVPLRICWVCLVRTRGSCWKAQHGCYANEGGLGTPLLRVSLLMGAATQLWRSTVRFVGIPAG